MGQHLNVSREDRFENSTRTLDDTKELVDWGDSPHSLESQGLL